MDTGTSILSAGPWGERGWEAAISLIYPGVCGICEEQRVTAREGYVCRDCASRPGHVREVTAPYCRRCGLPFEGAVTEAFECSNCREVDLSFEWARASVVATPFVLDLVHRYKYQRAVWFEPFLAGLLTPAASRELAPGEWDAIVPVPLHGLRRREREFNQAERLARWLGRETGLPVWADVVRRQAPTLTQALLDRRERAKNVARAFAVPDARRVMGCRLVVLDDVFTTGATTNAVSRVLRQSGARRIVVWTLARGAQTPGRVTP